MSLIETHALTKAFGFAPVLKKLDLVVERGEFVALLGHNGSGKSTLIRLLCGLSKPTTGRIVIGGWELPKEAAAVRARFFAMPERSRNEVIEFLKTLQVRPQ